MKKVKLEKLKKEIKVIDERINVHFLPDKNEIQIRIVENGKPAYRGFRLVKIDGKVNISELFSQLSKEIVDQIERMNMKGETSFVYDQIAIKIKYTSSGVKYKVSEIGTKKVIAVASMKISNELETIKKNWIRAVEKIANSVNDFCQTNHTDFVLVRDVISAAVEYLILD